VLVDGTARGTAPLDLPDLSPGPHTIRLALAGHVSTEVTLEPLPGSPPLIFRMQPVPRPAAGPTAIPAAPSPSSAATVVAAAPILTPPTVRPVESFDEVYEAGPGITPPRRIVGEPISYPREAERFKLQGTVSLEIVVDRDGRPTDLKILESAGEILDKATLDGVSQWRFEPAVRNGNKVRYRQLFRQTFRRGD
jgi:protein TonB